MAKADADAIAYYLELKLPSEVVPSISINTEKVTVQDFLSKVDISSNLEILVQIL